MKQLLLFFSVIGLSFMDPYSHLKAKYITNTLPLALSLELNYEVPLELTLAQSALESAWGQSYNAKYRCNYFGITDANGYYRVFDSKEESFHYYGKLLSNRYSDCLTLDHRESIECIHAKGYAKDENYADKLMKLFRQVRRMV